MREAIGNSQPSRRAFIRTGAGLAAAVPGLARMQPAMQRSPGREVFAYVGTYSSPQGPEGSKGRGQGIYIFKMNLETGELSHQDVISDPSNPSWLAFNPARTHLYAGNEITNYEGARSGSVSGFSVERATGGLNLLNTVSSEGAGPAHISVHPSGKFVLVANYAGGTVAVLPIGADGKLGAATDVKTDEGQPGSAHATSGPPGSFAISGHDRPHAHMIHSDASGRFVLSTDLGLDQIYVWKFDADAGKLTPNDPPFVSLPSGDGPRHFVFHPNGRSVYSLQEEASTVVAFDYDSASGRLHARQTLSTLPKEFTGTNFPSEIVISRDGKFLYTANRLHDSIAWFSINPAGALTYVGEEWTRGDYPRSFSIDPSGRFLYSCNQRSDAITCFRVDRNDGRLSFTGQYTPVGTPAIIVFPD